MEILERNYSGNSLYQITTAFFEKRIVFVEREITNALADEFAKQMGFLQISEPDALIRVVINSPGGEVDAGLKMVDVLSGCKCPVEAYCFGQAYSMAAVIFEACPGKRKMVGHSKIMLHQPSVFSGASQKTAAEVEALSEQMKEKARELLSIVSKRSGIPLKKLEKETISDRYFDAKEAVSVGLADDIVTFSDMFF